jgi:hypothetical protein
MRGKQTKQTVKPSVKAKGLNHSLISFEDALLVVSHSLKTDSDLLTLERLVYQGITLEQLKQAYPI